jgi:hypothetical protein
LDRWAFPAIVSVVFIGTFACGVYLARDSPRDFAFVIVTYYLFALLLCCLEKLSLLRRDDPAAAAERWRVKLAVWVLLVMLADAIAKHVADAMPDLGLRIAVRVITGVVVGVGFYFYFLHGDAGCRTGSAVHQVSPEQRV